MKNQYKKIILLGRSDKFVKAIHALFEDAELVVVPWRGCDQFSHYFREDFAPDLVVVCGYDYASGSYPFDRYLDVNVVLPFVVISKLCKDSAKVVYIDTEHGNGLATFSRYQYAKNLLADKILTGIDNAHVLSIPTVADPNGRADIRGGLVTKMIFNIFIRIGLVRTMSSAALVLRLSSAINSDNKIKLNLLRPRFLSLRRSLFIDRLLRFVGG